MAIVRKFVALLVFIIITVNSFSGTGANTQCMSTDNTPVDWFIVYKLPKIPKSNNGYIQDGVGFFYMDVNSPKWVLSEVPINMTGQHALYNTLQQIYANKTENYMFALYNDHPPNSKEYSHRGHTKGVVTFDTSTGFWLVHSTPQFPPLHNASYSWPSSAHDYGQSFLCISMNVDMLDIIGKQLMYTYPKIYESYMSAPLVGKFPVMADVVQNDKHVSNPPWFLKASLESIGGKKYDSFAKFSDFDEELYSAWVAPTYSTQLMTETWQNGRGKLPSNCTANYRVFNVQNIAFNQTSTVTFKETKDHSKWAVSTGNTPSKNIICIGGINREEPQEHRAGGTVCTIDAAVWKEFSAIVLKYEKCQNETKVPHAQEIKVIQYN
ncbi:hypothetical protein ScPMuIL_011252 [Solemya velum]